MTSQARSPITITTGLLCLGLLLSTAPTLAHHDYNGSIG